MRQYNTFSQTESLLLTAIQLPGQSIKSIAEATGIKANTLYKCKDKFVLKSVNLSRTNYLSLLGRTPVSRLNILEK